MTRPFDDDPLGDNQTPFLRDLQRKTLWALLLALSSTAPLVTLGVYLREGWTPLFWVCVSLMLTIWLGLALFQSGRVRGAAQLVITAILMAGATGIAAQGSVRSAGVLVMLAGVVGAGAFLPRRQMVTAAVVSLVVLGVLNIMESHGRLGPANLQVGWALWITQAAVLLSIMVSVFYGRIRTRDAFVERELALERAGQVTNELRQSERRFAALFHGNPVATLVQDKATQQILDLNHAFTQLFGYSREELLGKTATHLWAEGSAQLAFRDALNQEHTIRELRGSGRRADGSLVDVMLYAEIITEGSEELVISMVLDMSAQTSARRALERSEERFSKAFHFSPIGMTITRLSDGMFMEVNPANERVLGYSAADFAEKTSQEVGVWVREEDRQQYVAALQKEGRLIAYETRMRSKAGEIVPVRIWCEIIDIDGQPCSLAFTMNVAEEKAREAMLLNVAKGVSSQTGAAFFRSLAEHLASAIGADGVMAAELEASGQLRCLAALWQGQAHAGGCEPLDQSACGQTLRHTELFVCTDEVAQRFNLKLPFQDRGARAFAGMPLIDPDGGSIGLLAAMWSRPFERDSNTQALLSIFASRCSAELVRLRREEDIRRLNTSLEQRVRQRTSQLEYLNRELDTFAYTVSHDLKSPLRAIDGFSHLLREQLADHLQADDQELFDRVDGSVQRMGSLINDLLALARVSQGTLQRMDTDLSEVAASVLRQERHRDPGRSIEVSIAPGLRAHCDPRLAQIVMENLMGNAWKYSQHQSEARIVIDQAPPAPGQAPEFFIQDNGAGFDMARADRLFKPFTRLHSPTEFEGTGIGLATVRRILERHGGHIRAQAAVGEGATFWFSFGHPGVD